MEKGLSNFVMDIYDLLRKNIEVANQYNEPDTFETSPYTSIPPQTLIEYYVAKYLRGRLDGERWSLLSKKPIDGVIHDIRLAEKELPQAGERTPRRKQKFKIITIDLFTRLRLLLLSDSDSIQNRKVEFFTITLDEPAAKTKAKMETSGAIPESYFVALIILPAANDGEEIDLSRLAKGLRIPREKLFVCSKIIDIVKLFKELVEMIWSLKVLFESKEENIKH